MEEEEKAQNGMPADDHFDASALKMK